MRMLNRHIALQSCFFWFVCLFRLYTFLTVLHRSKAVEKQSFTVFEVFKSQKFMVNIVKEAEQVKLDWESPITSPVL